VALRRPLSWVIRLSSRAPIPLRPVAPAREENHHEPLANLVASLEAPPGLGPQCHDPLTAAPPESAAAPHGRTAVLSARRDGPGRATYAGRRRGRLRRRGAGTAAAAQRPTSGSRQLGRRDTTARRRVACPRTGFADAPHGGPGLRGPRPDRRTTAVPGE